MCQETRRHRRLVKKAAKLDVRDLLDICAMKGMQQAGEPAGAHASASSSSTPGGEAVPPPASAAEPDAEDAVPGTDAEEEEVGDSDDEAAGEHDGEAVPPSSDAASTPSAG